MNELEKRSFYSFLTLYIFSSFFFIALTAYWYYTAQKNALENETYYKLEHMADMKAGEIIMAHMKGVPLKLSTAPKDIRIALVDTAGNVVKGTLVYPRIPLKPGYYSVKGYKIVVSDAPREHLGIGYVIVQTDTFSRQLEHLQKSIWKILILVSLSVVLVAWVLSRIFMKPLQERVSQVERFINDITHELNTPISSLSMATDQALKKGECTTKTLNNISISTKQLYDIYRSLTYLNFDRKTSDEKKILDMDEVLHQSIRYYQPLAQMKRITFDLKILKHHFSMPQSQATLLFGNLISNAIKYSPPGSKITIELQNGRLLIKDEGIGIDPKKRKEIFEKFKRATEYSGGFGVGLSIVKSICDVYGIKIEVDSTPNQGTEFRLVF